MPGGDLQGEVEAVRRGTRHGLQIAPTEYLNVIARAKPEAIQKAYKTGLLHYVRNDDKKYAPTGKSNHGLQIRTSENTCSRRKENQLFNYSVIQEKEGFCTIILWFCTFKG